MTNTMPESNAHQTALVASTRGPCAGSKPLTAAPPNPLYAYSCLLLLTLALAGAPLTPAADTSSQAPTHLSGPDALDREAANLARAFSNAMPAVPSQASQTENHTTLAIILVAAVGGIFLLLKVFPVLGTWLKPGGAFAAVGAGPDAPALAAEEKSFFEFADSFVLGPRAPDTVPVLTQLHLENIQAGKNAHSKQTESAPPPSSAPAEPTVKTPAPRAEEKAAPELVFRSEDPAEFLAAAPKMLSIIRGFFSRIGRAPDEVARQQLLTHLAHQFEVLKTRASQPALLPLWQMASALEGLLKQMADKPTNVTQSSLRTVGAGLDLLSALCAGALRPDLATVPPVRLLAVDDDAICRQAVSFALRKVFSQPDTAGSGEAGLALARQQPYDLIFLDIEMPDIDGFELCARIHETAPNQTTPVVFVTCHGDFNARAASCGGQDLLGKPFLSFELAVKALTLVLRRRLGGNVAKPVAPTAPQPAKVPCPA